MKNKKIKLKTLDGFSIAGIHSVSDSTSVALWLHGITVNKDEYLNLFKDGAEFLGNYGTDSLRIDFRGHGESSGKSIDFSIIGQMIDVDSAILYLQEYYKKEKINLHIISCSFGAPPSIFTAFLKSEIIKSITMIAPVLSYQRTFIKPETEWARSIFNLNTISNLYKTGRLYINDEFPVGIKLFKEMQLIQPEVFIGQLNQKVTIIHGDSDSMVPYNVSREISKKYNKIKLISIKEMDHGFNDINDEIGNSEASIKNKQYIYNIIKENVLNEKV
jgi:uncharacterized protein